MAHSSWLTANSSRNSLSTIAVAPHTRCGPTTKCGISIMYVVPLRATGMGATDRDAGRASAARGASMTSATSAALGAKTGRRERIATVG